LDDENQCKIAFELFEKYGIPIWNDSVENIPNLEAIASLLLENMIVALEKLL
jgi:hypothetical protein